MLPVVAHLIEHEHEVARLKGKIDEHARFSGKAALVVGLGLDHDTRVRIIEQPGPFLRFRQRHVEAAWGGIVAGRVEENSAESVGRERAGERGLAALWQAHDEHARVALQMRAPRLHQSPREREQESDIHGAAFSSGTARSAGAGAGLRSNFLSIASASQSGNPSTESSFARSGTRFTSGTASAAPSFKSPSASGCRRPPKMRAPRPAKRQSRRTNTRVRCLSVSSESAGFSAAAVVSSRFSASAARAGRRFSRRLSSWRSSRNFLSEIFGRVLLPGGRPRPRGLSPVPGPLPAPAACEGGNGAGAVAGFGGELWLPPEPASGGVVFVESLTCHPWARTCTAAFRWHRPDRRRPPSRRLAWRRRHGRGASAPGRAFRRKARARWTRRRPAPRAAHPTSGRNEQPAQSARMAAASFTRRGWE